MFLFSSQNSDISFVFLFTALPRNTNVGATLCVVKTNQIADGALGYDVHRSFQRKG